MSEIVAHAWLSGRETIGVVIVFDDIMQQYKGYIASVTGANEEADLQWVKERGTHIKLQPAIGIIAGHGEWYAGEMPADVFNSLPSQKQQNEISREPGLQQGELSGDDPVTNGNSDIN